MISGWDWAGWMTAAGLTAVDKLETVVEFSALETLRYFGGAEEPHPKCVAAFGRLGRVEDIQITFDKDRHDCERTLTCRIENRGAIMEIPTRASSDM